MFGTPTKPDAEAGGLELVRAARDTLHVPWFAIGGVELDTVAKIATPRARSWWALAAVHAPRWVNHLPPAPSWKTTVFSPVSSTTSK